MFLAIFVSPGTGVKVTIVVTPDHNLVGMRKAAEPVHSSLDLAHRAIIGKISGVDKEVAVWHVRPFEGVSVGDANDSDRVDIGRW